MIDGLYKVAFIGQGEGSGVVILRGTHFSGGDGYFYYSGVFSEDVGEMTASFKVKRHTPGTASVFGRDSITVTLSGLAGKKEFSLEAPGKAFTITGTWLENANFGPTQLVKPRLQSPRLATLKTH